MAEAGDRLGFMVEEHSKSLAPRPGDMREHLYRRNWAYDRWLSPGRKARSASVVGYTTVRLWLRESGK